MSSITTSLVGLLELLDELDITLGSYDVQANLTGGGQTGREQPVGRREPRGGILEHHQGRYGQTAAGRVPGDRQAGRVEAAGADVGVDPVAQRSPALDRPLLPVVLHGLHRPVRRDPGHHLR